MGVSLHWTFNEAPSMYVVYIWTSRLSFLSFLSFHGQIYPWIIVEVKKAKALIPVPGMEKC